ncbi:MAG: PEP-CTERM sorting domain-containing protein [Planctomycetia bacterium]|nr:PEP-CTERM sorting domain-containing protein [Planctomycetia bacterium]
MKSARPDCALSPASIAGRGSDAVSARWCSAMSSNFLRLAAACVLLLFGAAVGPASAGQISSWNGGGGNGNWTDALNWTSIPMTSGTWSLVFQGNTQNTGTNTIGAITVDSISLTNNGALNRGNLFTLSGSALLLSSAAISTTGTLGGGSLAAAGDTIANAVVLAGTTTVTTGVGHNLTLSGSIGGTGAVRVNGSNNSGWLYLSGTNGYSGGTTVTSGLVQNGQRNSTTQFSSGAFGSGPIVVSGSGTVQIRNGSLLTNELTIGGSGAISGSTSLGALRGSFGVSGTTAVIAGSVTLSDNARVTTGASSGVTNSRFLISGPVSLGANTLTLAPALANSGTSSSSALPIEIAGSIGGAGSVVIAGNPYATSILSGSNDFAGGVTVNSGLLKVENDHAVGSGPLVVNGGGLLQNQSQALQVGSLDLKPDSQTLLGISGTSESGFGHILAATSVNFGGSLSIGFLQAGFPNDTRWQLFSGASFASGTFSSITAQGLYGSLTFVDLGGGKWQATGGSLANNQKLLFFQNDSFAEGDMYTAGQLVLVPEPSTIAMAVAGLVSFGLLRRRRQRSSAAAAPMETWAASSAPVLSPTA